MNKVLLIDDDPIICKGLTELINWHTYGFSEVNWYTSAEEALEDAREKTPALVVTDIRMNGMNGLELIRKLHNEHLCKKSIVISSYAEFEYAQVAMAFGVQHYLLKPVSRLKLEQAVIDIAANLPKKEEGNKPAPLKSSMNKRKQKMDLDLTNYIREHYKENISISDLANYLHITPSYIGQQFHEIMGKTFSEYLNEYRISCAIDIMSQGFTTIYEICDAVGYQDIAYFYKCFKKITGMTPNEYRNSSSHPNIFFQL